MIYFLVRSPYKRGGGIPEKKSNISPPMDRRRGLDRGMDRVKSPISLKRKKAPSPIQVPSRKPSTHHAAGARKKRHASSSESGDDFLLFMN